RFVYFALNGLLQLARHGPQHETELEANSQALPVNMGIPTDPRPLDNGIVALPAELHLVLRKKVSLDVGDPHPGLLSTETVAAIDVDMRHSPLSHGRCRGTTALAHLRGRIEPNRALRPNRAQTPRAHDRLLLPRFRS